jgi:cyclase
MYGDEAVLDAVTNWRLPDITFESRMEIDLGGMTAELWHFGPGSGAGDTARCSPAQRTPAASEMDVPRGMAVTRAVAAQ